MSMNPKVIQKSGKFGLTKHAQEKIRQRVGIEALEAATAWVNEEIAKATEYVSESNTRFSYVTDSYKIVCGGLSVITVVPVDNHVDYAAKLGGVLTKEVTRLLTRYQRDLRRAEIKVAEITLNFLKAKNPNIKAGLQRKLTEAADAKAKIADEIRAVEIAAERYGVDVG